MIKFSESVIAENINHILYKIQMSADKCMQTSMNALSKCIKVLTSIYSLALRQEKTNP